MGFKAIGCVIFACIVAQVYGNYVEGYCWRDYDGSIPLDALKAGVDSNGKSAYISQTLISNTLLPGRIFEWANKDQFIVNETVKILCSEYPASFEWVKTRIDQVLNIRNKNIFEGGYHKGYLTYVARVLRNGEVMITEVTCLNQGCNKVVSIKNGVRKYHDDFDILTYDETVASKSSVNSYGSITLLFLIYFFQVLVRRVLK